MMTVEDKQNGLRDVQTVLVGKGGAELGIAQRANEKWSAYVKRSDGTMELEAPEYDAPLPLLEAMYEASHRRPDMKLAIKKAIDFLRSAS